MSPERDRATLGRTRARRARQEPGGQAAKDPVFSLVKCLPPSTLSTCEDILLLEGRLVIVELQVRQIGEVDREVEGKVSVCIPHEIESRPPLV
jgi:hypothetical protein